MKDWKKLEPMGVYRRKDGRLAVKVGVWKDGKMVFAQQNMELNATVPEAAQLALTLQAQLRTPPPTPVAPRPDTGQSVERYAREWLDSHKQTLKPAAARHYESAIWDHFVPKLGYLACHDMTRAMLASWVIWLDQQVQPTRHNLDGSVREGSGEPYSKDTLTSWWRPVVQMLRDMAADLNMLDPTLRVKPPKGKPGAAPKREMRCLTGEGLKALLLAARRYTPDRYAELVMLGFTAMRPGEIYALRWDACELDTGTLHVRRSVSDGQLTETTKTSAARTTRMNAVLLDALIAHQAWQQKRNRPAEIKSGLVFPSTKGTPREGNSLNSALEIATEAAGIKQKVTPQVLRRSVNTLGVLAGVDRITLRAMMGHTSEEMTQRYSGVPDAAKDRALEMIFGELLPGFSA